MGEGVLGKSSYRGLKRELCLSCPCVRLWLFLFLLLLCQVEGHMPQ